MNKDFSWDKSALQYKHMYEDISDIDGSGEYIAFEDAFAALKHCYQENAKANIVKHADLLHEGYHRVVQIEIVGRGAGFMHVEFVDGKLHVRPEPRPDAEAFITCSYDNLLAMGRGFVTTDKLFLNGQLKLSGNLSKGFEIRNILTPGK